MATFTTLEIIALARSYGRMVAQSGHRPALVAPAIRRRMVRQVARFEGAGSSAVRVALSAFDACLPSADRIAPADRARFLDDTLTVATVRPFGPGVK